jgi:hypothetical protein
VRIECKTEILRPPEAVFPWIADPEKAMKWQKNVKEGEITASKPEMVGTTFRELVEEGGRTLEMHGVITRFDENRTIGFHIESRIHGFDVSYSLEARSQSTHVFTEVLIKWKFPMNVVCLLLGKKMKKEIARKLESEHVELKRLCET